MQIHINNESSEDYLETIYILEKKNGVVKSADIAREFNYSRASISRAMGILEKNGLIIFNQKSHIILTEEGIKKAKSIYDRHITLKKFLITVTGVDDNTAEMDACRIEHFISPETFQGIKKYLKNLDK